jgi:hypothetical protein
MGDERNSDSFIQLTVAGGSTGGAAIVSLNPDYCYVLRFLLDDEVLDDKGCFKESGGIPFLTLFKYSINILSASSV